MECRSSECLRSTADLGRLREQVRRLLHGAPTGAVETAELVIDELATNALLAGRQPITLRLQRGQRDRTLWIEVYDHSASSLATADAVLRGRLGKRMLEQLCTAWGVVPGDSVGRTVWAELPLHHGAG